VTGSLMKVYDGAAMVADKANAEVVPVRIEGSSRHPSAVCPRAGAPQVVPQGHGHVLEPVRLTSTPRSRPLRGRRLAWRSTRSCRTGLPHHLDRSHRGGSRDRGRAPEWRASRRGRDPLAGALSYKRLLIGASVLGTKLMPLARVGRPVGVDAAECQRHRGHGYG